MATLYRQVALPFGINRFSGSLPRWLIKITLLIDGIDFSRALPPFLLIKQQRQD